MITRRAIKLGEAAVSNYGYPYIIAELGANHNGDMELARRLVLAAKNAGCHAVKFQSWTKDSIFSRTVYDANYFLTDDYRDRNDFTLEQIVEAFSVSEQQLYELKLLCDAESIQFCCTPFSRTEVDFLVDVLDVPFIKVASMDLNNYPLLRYIASKGRPILLSVGLSDLSEVDEAVRAIEEIGNDQLVLLHCISVYPPDDADVNLNNIHLLRTAYPSYPIGFSDHTMGYEIPLAAVALGACVIEKHFTLDQDMFGWDHKVSATPDQMKIIAHGAKRIHEALGSTRKIVGSREKRQREAFRRSLVAARDIPQGKIIEREDMDLKRPGTGLSPTFLDFIVGRVAQRAIKYDELILKEDV